MTFLYQNPVPTTAQTIIYDALKEISVLAEGDVPSASMLDDALRALNRLMGLYSNSQTFAYFPSTVSMALTGQSSFTIGPTGDVVDDRPISVDSARVVRDGISYPCRATNDNKLYDSIIYKEAPGANPTVIYYEPLMPNGVAKVWPIATGCTINLRVLNLVVSFPDLTTVLSMPPGYEELFIKNLAVNISPQYPSCILSKVTVDAAKTARDTISKTNNSIPTMGIDAALTGYDRGGSLAAFLGGY